jgi:CheY-like chemotaxis protein
MQDIFETRGETPEMLIADDDPAIARLLADRCMKMGFKVETATNGLQLLIKARRSQPDIIIVDVNMPELDGLSACTRLLDPGSKSLEVVMVNRGLAKDIEATIHSAGAFLSDGSAVTNCGLRQTGRSSSDRRAKLRAGRLNRDPGSRRKARSRDPEAKHTQSA